MSKRLRNDGRGASSRASSGTPRSNGTEPTDRTDRKSRTYTADTEMEVDVFDDGQMEFSIEELREFLAADFVEVSADPAFKNQLRNKLWAMVRSRSFGYGPSDN